MKNSFRQVSVFLITFLFLITGIAITPLKIHASDDYTNHSQTWGFASLNCTAFAAWRINRDMGTTSSPYFFNNNFLGNGTVMFGNANNWNNAAATLGWDVDNYPRKGDIAVWEAGVDGADATAGHVAYVESVNYGSNTINLSEYNWNVHLGYGERSNFSYSGKNISFIHFKYSEKISINTISYNSNFYYTTIDSSGYIKWRVQDSNGNLGSWSSIGEGAKYTPALAVSNGILYVSIVGNDNNIYIRSLNGSTWGSWASGGGTVQGNTTLMDFGGVLYQGMIGEDGHARVRSYNGSWSSWSDIGSTARGNLDMEVYGSSIYFAMRGTDKNLYFRSFNGSTWSGWTNGGGTFDSNIKLKTFNSKLYQAAIASDKNLMIRSFDGSSWSSWSNIGGTFQDSPSLSVYNGSIFFSAVGTDRNVYSNSYNGTTWGGWSNGGGPLKSEAVNSPHSNGLYQTIITTDGSLMRRIFTSSWQSWSYL